MISPPTTWAGTFAFAVAASVLAAALVKVIERATAQISATARERARAAASRREERIDSLMRSPSSRVLSALIAAIMTVAGLAILVALGYTASVADLATRLAATALVIADAALITVRVRDLMIALARKAQEELIESLK